MGIFWLHLLHAVIIFLFILPQGIVQKLQLSAIKISTKTSSQRKLFSTLIYIDLNTPYH